MSWCIFWNHTRRLLLFTRSTTEKLAQKSQTLEYTDQALAYLWRTSGGYPSLVQLICYQVFEDWKKPGTQGQNQEKTITLARVRSALSNLLANTDVNQFFRYIYRYSFTKEEREILSKVVQSADRTTLKIDPEGVKKHLLDALETKQVIERRAENGDDWYLRIGFFKLWIELWPEPKQREANDNIQEKEL